MPTSKPDFYSKFAATSRDFITSADKASLGALFPGNIVSPGDCLSPVCLTFDEAFVAFQVEAGSGKETSFCFSKVLFAGTANGSDEVTDVSEFAECSHSSGYMHLDDPRAGIEGTIYGNNIHTSVEANPWWRAEFPEHVRVKHIYFYRRVDKAVIHEDHLCIVGEAVSGEKHTLYYPEMHSVHVSVVADNIQAAVMSLQALRDEVSGDKQGEYDQRVSEALAELDGFFDEISTARLAHKGGVLTKLKNKLSPKKPKKFKPAVALALRQAIADKLLDAAYEAVGGAKDFGCTKEDGLTFSAQGFNAGQLRFRVYGELPPAMAGAEVRIKGSPEPIEIARPQLAFKYRPSGLDFPESYGIGLCTQIRSRVVNLGEVQQLESISVWNLDEQHAGNTAFIEISGRAHEDDPWTILYDRGGPYRHAFKIFKLADYLLRSAWTPSYARLLGKLLTQYRRRTMMKPVARLVRGDEALNKALFEGAKVIPPQVKHAAPLVLGKHGLQVPIGFRPLEDVMKHLTKIRDLVREAGHAPLFMYGTLLGAIREKGFIPHDDDLDLAIIFEDTGPEGLMKARDELLIKLNAVGLKCNAGSETAPLIHCRRGPITIDIFAFGRKGDTVYWPHTDLVIVPERADIFVPTTTIEFFGETFDAPADPEAVCEARYGSDWRIPNPAFEF